MHVITGVELSVSYAKLVQLRDQTQYNICYAIYADEVELAHANEWKLYSGM